MSRNCWPNIDNVIEDVMKDTESAEAENGVEYRLPEQLHDRQELQGMIQERLREMDQQSRDQVMPSRCGFSHDEAGRRSQTFRL